MFLFGAGGCLLRKCDEVVFAKREGLENIFPFVLFVHYHVFGERGGSRNAKAIVCVPAVQLYARSQSELEIVVH